jgi:hypothetical protein
MKKDTKNGYAIVSEYVGKISVFLERVRNLIDGGWRPFGDIVFCDSRIYQVLVKGDFGQMQNAMDRMMEIYPKLLATPGPVPKLPTLHQVKGYKKISQVLGQGRRSKR